MNQRISRSGSMPAGIAGLHITAGEDDGRERFLMAGQEITPHRGAPGPATAGAPSGNANFVQGRTVVRRVVVTLRDQI